ncbi:MAG: segregation/condensation protein A [Ignavibacteriaceae bacterium]|nr:segregation/condensation protein A [Ignavibacteriaceae bacterium]
MYKIKLELFEGPLDLLLFFIKRDEIDIYDIPISKITSEFLEYVNLIKYLDLEIAGDFILMASTLMHIKVRLLLPREIDERGEEIDPRAELVSRLLEYKRFKEMSEDMSILEANQRKVFFRNNYLYDPVERPPELETLLRNVSVYDLAKVFKKVIENNKPIPVHEIKKIPVSIEDQINFINTRLESHSELHFLSIVDDIREKIRLVVTFIALLEMVKMGRLGIRISENFNDFILYKIQ